MDGSSVDEGGLRSGLRRGTEISSIDEGELDGSRSSDEQSPGSLLRRGIKFSSVDEFLNFLKEGEVSDECSLSDPSCGSFQVEEEEYKKQSDLTCKSAVVEGGMPGVNVVNVFEGGVADKRGSKKNDKPAEVDKSGWPECRGSRYGIFQKNEYFH